MGGAKRRALTGLARVSGSRFIGVKSSHTGAPKQFSWNKRVVIQFISSPPPPPFSPESNRSRYERFARICTLDSRDSNFFSISFPSSLSIPLKILLDFLTCRRKIKISGQIRKEDAKNWRKDKNLWIDAKSNILETESKEFLLAWIRSFVAKCKIVGEGRRNDRR